MITRKESTDDWFTEDMKSVLFDLHPYNGRLISGLKEHPYYAKSYHITTPRGTNVCEESILPIPIHEGDSRLTLKLPRYTNEKPNVSKFSGTGRCVKKLFSLDVQWIQGLQTGNFSYDSRSLRVHRPHKMGVSDA